jgi:c-di-GMP-binding flagellar brake protein YcgR
MSSGFDSERRDFVRIKVALSVRYKFLSRDVAFATQADEIFEGSTSNVSGGGLLLKARVPDLQWLAPLLMERIVIGLNIHLPHDEAPVKALTRVAWIEAIEEGTQKCLLGLRFKEVSQDDQDRILQYIIRCQMPG